MITKDQYIASLAFEFDVIKHLVEKVDAAHLEFRPTPKQRSTNELLSYLTTIFGAALDNIRTGDQGAYKVWAEKTPAVTLENFAALMDAEAAHVKAAIEAMSETELAETVTIFGTTRTRAEHLMNGPIKWAAAYKMQLFMYLKMTGAEHLNTMNLWAGMDGKMGA